jgi:sodium-independent sulfate anion transporter 11
LSSVLGFQNAGVPILDKRIASSLVSYLPASVIVLLIEHIAISKSFGRLNNYTINPSQEMVAIGVTNLLGPFLGGYAATGSFSRTAIKSKAGVRTPFAGVITAVVVLLAIYCLTALFYWIPNASLSAVIIHAVGDLISPPNTLYKFWRVNPLEVVIFMVGVIVTVFSTIEVGIYCTVSISAALLLYRLLRERGRFLGLVRVHSVLGDYIIGASRPTQPSTPLQPRPESGEQYGTFNNPAGADKENTFKDMVTPPVRNIFLPVGHEDGSNPNLILEAPYPGIFIFRFSEGFTYPNAGNSLDQLTSHIAAQTRRTNLSTFDRPGDRPWNDPGPSPRALKAARKAGIDQATLGQDVSKPTLKAIILDFSTVNNVDVTSVQALIDVRNQLDRYTAPDVVDWHFANIHNRWTKRALVSAGFGYPTERPDGLHHRWKGIFSVAELGGSSSAAAAAESDVNEKVLRPAAIRRASQRGKVLEETDIDVEQQAGSSEDGDLKDGVEGTQHESGGVPPLIRPRRIPVHGINRPLFHIDLTSALQSAITNVEARSESSTP